MPHTKKANTLLDNVLKRILKVPQTTPREALYLETGLLDVECAIKKNRISMEARIINGNNQTMKNVLKLRNKNCWAEQNKKLKEELNIQEEDIMNTKYHLKKTLQDCMIKHMNQNLTKTALSKSKMQHYKSGIQQRKPGKRAMYMSKLTRNQASVIFKARTRMLKVKDNYRNGHRNLLCRLCGKTEETQMHILEECLALNEIPVINKETIFEENLEILKDAVINIEKRMEITE